ncbi:HesA/MoeB/ThiF family protein [Methanobrevibacter sp. UBA212]|jgi:molybdopterin/thiamine biosynthesis adenylyltransferase|uniref:HesA/MoeB/ThiF family protein n=1 Tax=Methanobrevibacter sp. UBA212 TaxID=1915476 RepID=UPI0025E95F51|nr:HesA/MoeB/ThiF family protein [Methanobrevibacter sp. UBA212]MEE1150790.1 HesA/MoeB/ThiF family protein [Methanobrevibacter sp.]
MPTRYIGDGYWEIASRQMSIVTRSEQERFKDAKITVIGCGGIGGETIEMLARMGIGELILVDKDAYDLSNLNRQTLATIKDLGLVKSEVAAEKVRLINPYVKTTTFNEHIDQTNIDKVISDSDIVIDALDNVLTRVIVSRKAKEKGIPYIHGAIHGTMGQITVFLPNSDKTYEEMFNLPSVGKELDDETIEALKNVTSGVPPVIGPTPNLIGCLEAFEAYKIITGVGKVTVAPKILTFDLLDLASFTEVEL